MNALRHFLRKSPLLFDAAKAVSRRLGNRTLLYSFLTKHIPRDRDVTFIQIGAGDGLVHDPYREFILRDNLRGVLVEPLPFQFTRLRRNYSRKRNVVFLNCAVSYPPGTIQLFTLDEKFLGQNRGRDLLLLQAATSRERLLESLSIVGLRNAEKYVVELLVPGRTIEDIMAKENYSSFDCLFLDLEGYEPHVLLNLDYSVSKPKLIAYEHIYLGQSAERIQLRLEEMGFRLIKFSQDTVAVAGEWLAPSTQRR